MLIVVLVTIASVDVCGWIAVSLLSDVGAVLPVTDVRAAVYRAVERERVRAIVGVGNAVA